MASYPWIGGLSRVDAVLNVSMIAAGMGPVDELRTAAAAECENEDAKCP